MKEKISVLQAKKMLEIHENTIRSFIANWTLKATKDLDERNTKWNINFDSLCEFYVFRHIKELVREDEETMKKLTEKAKTILLSKQQKKWD